MNLHAKSESVAGIPSRPSRACCIHLIVPAARGDWRATSHDMDTTVKPKGCGAPRIAIAKLSRDVLSPLSMSSYSCAGCGDRTFRLPTGRQVLCNEIINLPTGVICSLGSPVGKGNRRSAPKAERRIQRASHSCAGWIRPLLGRMTTMRRRVRGRQNGQVRPHQRTQPARLTSGMSGLANTRTLHSRLPYNPARQALRCSPQRICAGQTL